MKINSKSILSVVSAVFLISGAFCGCTEMESSRVPGENTSSQDNAQNQAYERNMVNATSRYGQDNNYGTNNNYGMNMGVNPDNSYGVKEQSSAFDQKKASNIKTQLMKMEGITDANVMVMGDTALVSFKTTGNTGNETALKNSIMKKVKAIDTSINNVTVSESSDIMSKMNKLGSDIKNNKPVKTITEEFNSMIKGMETAAP